MSETACLACGHDVDRHFGMSELPYSCGTKDEQGVRCHCFLRPSDIALDLIAKVRADERERLEEYLQLARADERERIAQAIEAKADDLPIENYVLPDVLDVWRQAKRDIHDAARIARNGGDT